MMRQEKLENLTLTGYTESKAGNRKHSVTYLTNLCKWMVEEELGRRLRGTNIAKWGISDRELLRAIIASS